jgi:hypothetical protein
VPLGKINRWLSGAEASKIASTPLSERLNLMAVTLRRGNQADTLDDQVFGFCNLRQRTLPPYISENQRMRLARRKDSFVKCELGLDKERARNKLSNFCFQKKPARHKRSIGFKRCRGGFIRPWRMNSPLPMPTDFVHVPNRFIEWC